VKTCAPRITDIQARCYLARYDDLQAAFGTSDSAWVRAMEHFDQFGFKEGRKYQCDEQPKMCAD